jgi:site-specific recombinase XerD
MTPLSALTPNQQQLLAGLLEQLAGGDVATSSRKTRGKRKQQRVPHYLSEEEIDRFFAAIPKTDARSRAIFRLMYHRGLRVSEIGIFRLEDCRQSTGRIFVRRLKGSRGGEYHMVEPERAALRAWLKVRGTAPGPLFPSRNHKPISRTRIFRLMRQYCAAAGIPLEKAHPHALKHSCGTHLSAREKDIVAVQDHLGHASLANTMKYVQVSSRRREELAERLDQERWGQ